MGLTAHQSSTRGPLIDRTDAGRRLSERLGHLRGQDVVVLGLPRGGVPVASEVAKALDAPLDVIIVRKLGVPSQPEVAMGAIAEGGLEVLDRGQVTGSHLTEAQVAKVEAVEQHELHKRAGKLRAGRPATDLRGRIALIVDDGLATGATARVACEAARRLGASRVVLAVPVAPGGGSPSVAGADEVICLLTPESFVAVGQYYRDFRAVTDDQVMALLAEADAREEVE